MKTPSEAVPSAALSTMSQREVAREFKQLLRDGLPIRCVGEARKEPEQLLSRGFTPKSKIELLETTFYFSKPRQNPDLRYFVAYVVQNKLQRDGSRGKREIYPRIFYKDISLVWRVGSHLVRTEAEFWVGKGDTRELVGDDGLVVVSDEATADLPFEMQDALEQLNQQSGKVQFNEWVLPLVLRTTTADRIEAYADFTAPRRWFEAREKPLNAGRRVIRFGKRNDPESLRFARGFEPDFANGLVERQSLRSSFYGGPVDRFRILSTNRRIQYLFYLAPEHAWAIPPQTMTGELSSYGVRTVSVDLDDDAFVPGYEYHFMDDSVDPPQLHSQIPDGFAGPQHPRDENRADASAWLDRLPMIREFRSAFMAG